MTTQQIPSSLGAQQFPEYLGIPAWQFERAVRLGHIPAPDRARRRWSRTVVQQVRDQLAGITAATGAVPDMGATRAAAYLTERFDTEVTADAVAELGRQGALRTAGTYKDHPLYDGLDLEQFEDLAAAQEAGRLGRQITRTEAAELLACATPTSGTSTAPATSHPPATPTAAGSAAGKTPQCPSTASATSTPSRTATTSTGRL